MSYEFKQIAGGIRCFGSYMTYNMVLRDSAYKIIATKPRNTARLISR
jgi:hypothetical protein